MLSRAAERVYWMGRYIERAESVARLVGAYSSAMMDMPRGAKADWGSLADIVGVADRFGRRYQNADERNVIKFLLVDTDNPGSIVASIQAARENVRTTRELLPTEAWEYVNRLHLFLAEQALSALARRNRFALLQEVVLRCQQISGLLAGTMSHDASWRFVRLGQCLERADMTTRIVDSAVYLLLPQQDSPVEHENLLWMNVLRSLSAYQMYRQHVTNRVVGYAVIRFLLHDRDFPRAVAHVLGEIESNLRMLPNAKAPLRCLGRLQRRVRAADIATMTLEDLHGHMDTLQINASELHDAIMATWILPPEPHAAQTRN
jgi:uncharacterized alpha-E superfamily protein